MPRSQFIDPNDILKPGNIKFHDIPVNRYNRTLEEECQHYSKADMLRIYRDMRMIREFETMLGEIKTSSVYKGIKYFNPGPTHLAIGEEAAAVGAAYALDSYDLIFGSHRNHGDVIAKGLSAIEKLEPSELTDIVKNYSDGEILKVIEREHSAEKDIAIDFLLYGTLAEIFARDNGFNRGLGGSMHIFFTPFGIYPNNAIVGAAAPMALGAALYKRINNKKGIVAANIGDGALGRGSVLESFNMAAMDQIKLLWNDREKPFGLPILFNVFDNFYGMGGQTCGETMGFGCLARIGAGINPEQMYSERVNGNDPFAVIDAVERRKKLLLDGKGPAMLDIVTYRTVGHSASDPFSYRTDEEIEEWKKFDPIDMFAKKLICGNIVSKGELETVDRAVEERIFRILALCADENISPRMDLKKNPDQIADLMFSNEHSHNSDTYKECELLKSDEENSRVKEIRGKNRSLFDKDGNKLAVGEYVEFRDALFEAVYDKFKTCQSFVAYGEEHRDWGGAHGVYRGLTETVPYHRFFNSPISEAAIVGSAVGYAICGGRVLVELMYADFLGCAADELFNQAAKWQSMSGGVLKMPLVVRVAVGSEYGAQHSQEWTALPYHIPGLKVVYPATPYDSKGLLNSALSGSDPVVFFESKRIYDVGEMFHDGGVPEGYYEVDIGKPDIKRRGKDVTILSIGAVLYRVLEAADILLEKYNIEAEVIDARSIVPFDYSLVIESIKKTKKIIIVGDGCERGSVMKDMAADLSEFAYEYLSKPVAFFGARNCIIPCYELEEDFFPQAETIIQAISEKLIPLDGQKNNELSKNVRLMNASKGV